MKRVVSEVVTFKHLILKVDLVFLINVTPAANLDLGDVCYKLA